MSLSENPYIVGPPIFNPKDFYGRNELLERLLQPKHQCFYLIGLRRIGKTSLLRQVQLKHNQKNKKISIYVSLQGNDSAESMGKELLYVIEQLANSGKHPILEEFLQMVVGKEHLNAVIETWILFSTKHPRLRTVLLFDEAEELLKLSTPEILKLRKLLVDSSANLNTIITGSRNLLKLYQNTETSPFLSGFQEIILPLLNEEESLALIQQIQKGKPKVKVNYDQQYQIFHYCGGHPYLTQNLCHDLFRRGQLNPIDPDEHLTPNEQMISIFRDEYPRFYPEEIALLKLLKFDSSIPRNELLALPYDSADLSVAIKYLNTLGLIRKKQNEFTLSNIYLYNIIKILLDKNKTVEKNTEPNSSKELKIIIYLSYSDHDEKEVDQLKVHLRSRGLIGKISLLDRSLVLPGEESELQLQSMLKEANVFCAILTKEYLADESIYRLEMNLISQLETHRKKIIPVLFKFCLWDIDPYWRELQAFPQDGQFILSKEHPDQAFVELVKIILQMNFAA